ncbi:S4 domain-containing protein [Steroidobacter flavus]|uniref:S4 domain-containing protein n=1 Tax=Steroidobacter flavus TaxID=1842136 RepID=A0ABV8SM32_9GAMM
MSERLHKLLAQHGLGSRREIEKWMLEGRVRLNNQPAQPGDRYNAGDRVSIDGKDVTSRIQVFAAPKVILYHKPQGQPITPTAEDESGEVAEKSVMESLPSLRGSRWLVVNTMQAGDSGLMLLTSDGRLADALRRRAETTPAAYVARVLVPFPEYDVDSIPKVVQYDDETIEFENIEPAGGEGTNRWFRVESHRAHRRAAVRALFESRGLKVSRVIQVMFGEFELPRDLPRGKHRELSESEVADLYASVELTLPIPPPKPEAPARPRRRPAPDRRKKPKRR